MSTAGDDIFQTLEQFEAIGELLEAETVVKARMGVILLDALADEYLHRRMLDLFEESDTGFERSKMPTYPEHVRELARRRFTKRVQLARDVTQVDHRWRKGKAFISERDAEVLRVGHIYRNAAYHEGMHHDAVMPGLARILLGVVVRLTVATREQSPFDSVWSSEPRWSSGLERWGLNPHAGASMRDIASVAESVSAALAVDPLEFRETLATDLNARVASLRKDVEFLADGWPIPPTLVILGVELWSLHGADPELVELRPHFDPLHLVDLDNPGQPSDDVIARVEAAGERYRERMNEIEEEHVPRVGLDLIDRAEREARNLRRQKDAVRILSRYASIDRPLSLLEEYMSSAVTTLDIEIQRQSDLERGK